MSAFVVSDDHINALITWAALARRNPNAPTSCAGYSYNGGAWTPFVKIEQHSAGILYTANVESVNDRYSNDTSSVGFQFKRYKKWQELTPVTVLKLCDCFDYQACEVENYRNTIAAQIIDGIRSHAISLLPDYESAPWGI